MLHGELSELYKGGLLDGFLLYLYAVVLRALEMPDEAKRVLCEAVRVYPLNWSAWLDLAAMCPDVGSVEMLMVHRSGTTTTTTNNINDNGGIASAADTSTNTASFADWTLPDHWVTQCFYGHVWGEIQHYERALEHFQDLEEELPGSQNCGWTKTRKAKVHHDSLVGYPEARALYEELRVQEPYRLEGLDLYSNILFMSERRAQLSHLAHSAIKVDKYRPETCCIVGNYYSLKKQHERAVLYFRRALKLDPHYLAAWTLMGHEYVEMRNTEAAIQAYRRAVDIDAKDYRAWYGLGQTYEILTMNSYALYYYRKAVVLRPSDARMWVALGQCYQKLKKTDEAIASYERADRHGDHDGIAALQLGKLFKGKRANKRAAQYFQKHVRKQDDEDRVGEGYAMALLFLARYYDKNERYAEAEACCQKLNGVGSHQETEEAKSIMRQIRSKLQNKTGRDL
jgi:anaphase-promoting complex subunit 8